MEPLAQGHVLVSNGIGTEMILLTTAQKDLEGGSRHIHLAMMPARVLDKVDLTEQSGREKGGGGGEGHQREQQEWN